MEILVTNSGFKKRCVARLFFFSASSEQPPFFCGLFFFRAMCDFILSNSEKQNQDNIWVFFKDMH